MLNFQLVQGPLDRAVNQCVLSEYNRLTGARIPIEEFEHWVQHSPAGPAWHALLQTDDGRVVGHTSLFPFRTEFGNLQLIPAKSEFSVLHADFRGMKIRGFEKAGKPAFVFILDQLFRKCLALGWGPIFASTNEKNQAFTRRIGLRPLEFPLSECILTLRPGDAARETPNLGRGQRAGLYAAGVAQRMMWSFARVLSRPSTLLESIPVDLETAPAVEDRLSFFEDPDSLRWRYFQDQYVRFGFDSGSSNYLIAKRGSRDRYLRVCQWRLESPGLARTLVPTLVRLAHKDRALGVRWAVYDSSPHSSELLSILKTFGFFCVRRVRIMMVHEKQPAFTSTSMWNMNDSLVTFDP